MRWCSRRWLNCQRINWKDKQEADLMTFSKCASLLRQMLSVECPRWTWSQKPPCAEQPVVGGVCLSWRVSQQLCIVHCTLCGFFSCRLFFLGSNVLPQGLCFVYIQGDPLPGGDPRCIHECLLCRSCQSSPCRNTWDALHAGAAEERQSHTLTPVPGHELSWAENEHPAHELFFSTMWQKLAAVQVLLHRSDSECRPEVRRASHRGRLCPWPGLALPL